MARQRVLSVVGTRPNFMKAVPVVARLAERPDAFESVLVHTGQHYDDAMSRIFFEQLGVAPDHYLDVGSGTHAVQSARVMERMEALLVELKPDLVLVPGDVNSTLAAALAAAKLNIPVGHIEAGLRSWDRTMPEEINRVLTDQIAELLFTHSPEAAANLLREGRRPEAIHAVGNTMIDSLVAMRDRIEELDAPAAHGLERGSYVVVTLHRPALVDDPALLAQAIDGLVSVSADFDVIFPVHPRTRANIRAAGIAAGADGLKLLDPLGYLEFLGLVRHAAAVLTDSGGIQEETTYLGVPCFTLRATTERPVTVDVGTNTLLGLRPERIAELPALIAASDRAGARVPDGWDGHAAERIAAVIEDFGS
jgi:UDP-N-acetylglucosamine 2-epimerase (non-hydrolysing)